jgi:type IV fimbrial biogenesis protein FimT
MKEFGRESKVESRVPTAGTKVGFCTRPSTSGPRPTGFTLIELILVLALVVVITSLAAPAMANFVRGQALGSEARRLGALIHAGRDRAVSEGLPMVLWVNEKEGAYGLQAEMTGRNGDPKAENLSLDANLQIVVMSTGLTGTTKFRGLPVIHFLPDGTVDENSPKTLRLTDARGNTLWLIESRNRTDYEIRDTQK